jgi:hypothetical protein
MRSELNIDIDLQFSALELEQLVTAFEKKLLGQTRHKYSFEKSWLDNFENAAGIYVGFDGNTLKYIGESANIRKRMGESRRTNNHSFRKQIGKQILKFILPKGKRRFNEEEEHSISEYYENNISIAYYPLIFGRKEVEASLIKRNRTPDFELLNKISKRDGEVCF